MKFINIPFKQSSAKSPVIEFLFKSLVENKEDVGIFIKSDEIGPEM